MSRVILEDKNLHTVGQKLAVSSYETVKNFIGNLDLKFETNQYVLQVALLQLFSLDEFSEEQEKIGNLLIEKGASLENAYLAWSHQDATMVENFEKWFGTKTALINEEIDAEIIENAENTKEFNMSVGGY